LRIADNRDGHPRASRLARQPSLPAGRLVDILNKMANISTNESNEAADAVRLLGFVMDMFKEQVQQWRENQSDWLANNRSTDVDQVQVGNATDRTVEELQLLMPVWAYQSAAAYLIFISVLGLFMNIIVVLVIISDPQVLKQSDVLSVFY
jgi:hypothetical protein